MSGWHRVLTPLGWLAVAAVVLVLLVAFSGFDPLGLRARKMEQLRHQAQIGEQAQKARASEVRENARLDAMRAQAERERAVMTLETGKLMGEAANDPSGQTVLGTDRLERLQQHDRLVCGNAATGACEPGTADPG